MVQLKKLKFRELQQDRTSEIEIDFKLLFNLTNIFESKIKSSIEINQNYIYLIQKKMQYLI